MPAAKYGDRFRSSANKKKSPRPDCFSDSESYRKYRLKCKKCDWKAACRALVLRERAREEEEDEEDEIEEEEDSRTTAGYKDPADFEERAESGGLSFFQALGINAGLFAVGSVLREITHAIDGIPRFPYEDPFQAAMDRGRRRATAEDDDE